MPKKKFKPSDERTLFSIESDDETREVSLDESNAYRRLFPGDASGAITPTYVRRGGLLFTSDCVEWLRALPDASVDLVFADPPYNVKKADWDKFESDEQYLEWSLTWIREASRVLKPTGSLYVCGFTEILADVKRPALTYFKSCKWLIWYYKNKANLGSDWGRSHESVLLLRKSKNFTMNVDAVRIPYNEHTLKYPERLQADTSQYANGKKRTESWVPNPLGAKPKDVVEIPTTCNGMGEKTNHPTQKPEELLRKLILAASDPGDLVVDPFSGSGTTIVVAEQLGRLWAGCDVEAEYNSWAIRRVDSVVRKSVDDWIAFDKENARRRVSIR